MHDLVRQHGHLVLEVQRVSGNLLRGEVRLARNGAAVLVALALDRPRQQAAVGARRPRSEDEHVVSADRAGAAVGGRPVPVAADEGIVIGVVAALLEAVRVRHGRVQHQVARHGQHGQRRLQEVLHRGDELLADEGPLRVGEDVDVAAGEAVRAQAGQRGQDLRVCRLACKRIAA